MKMRRMTDQKKKGKTPTIHSTTLYATNFKNLKSVWGTMTRQDTKIETVKVIQSNSIL